MVVMAFRWFSPRGVDCGSNDWMIGSACALCLAFSLACVHPGVKARSRVVTLVPIRLRWRCELHSLRTFAGASPRPPLAFNPRARCLSTPTDAFQLHPDIIASCGPSTLIRTGACCRRRLSRRTARTCSTARSRPNRASTSVTRAGARPAPARVRAAASRRLRARRSRWRRWRTGR